MWLQESSERFVTNCPDFACFDNINTKVLD